MFVEISELPESLNINSDSVFPLVFEGETKKVKFVTLKQVLNFFESVSYNKTTGVFTFTKVDGTAATLSTELNLSIKAISIVDGNVIITKQDGSTSTLSGLQLEITSENKLDADLIDDSSSTNKFTNATEKAGWDAKVDVDDYASNSTGGVIKTMTNYNTECDSQGRLRATTNSYSQYQEKGTNAFISKGTLENVIIGKDLTTKAYVDGLIGSIDTALDLINGESI